MKVINYTAFKKIEDSIYKQKAAEKSLKPSSRSIKFKSVKSVKSVRGGNFFSCRPFRKREKKAVKKFNFAWIKFRGWTYFSVFRVDLISRFLSKTAKIAKLYPRKVVCITNI